MVIRFMCGQRTLQMRNIRAAGCVAAMLSPIAHSVNSRKRPFGLPVTKSIIAAVLPEMHRRGRGHVVNMSSVAGLYPMASPIYGASKGAVHRLSQDLRIELGGSRVRLTEICPGRVATEFFDAAIDDPAKRSAVKDTGISELTSDDIAAAVIYAVDAPWRVNVSLIELQPTEQVFGGMSIVPATD